MLRFFKSYQGDEDGGVLVLVAVCLVVIMGMLALTFDLGRLAATQGDLQSYADHVALASAGELDGGLDSITRSTAAASTMIRDRQTFADGGQDLDSAADYSLRFLSGLPAVDSDDVTPFVTTNAQDAAFVEVTATPRTVFLPFARSMAGLLGANAPDEDVGAVAIAGFSQWACDVPPLMFCVPSSTYKADDPNNIGDAILLRSGGQGAAWGPGDFGFLDASAYPANPNGPCAGLNGSNQLICMIAASENLSGCTRKRGVDTEPGQKVGIENAAFNTRFDIFQGRMSKYKSDANYAPGPHVVSGLMPKSGNNVCLSNNAENDPDTMAFPPDDCHTAGNCIGGRIGDGNWTLGRETYMNTNYGGAVAGLNAATRYELYKQEIAQAGGEGGTDPIVTLGWETGRPRCSSERIEDPDRRVFIAAGIDCTANPISGRAKNVPVQEYFKIFLMQPVGNSAVSPPSFDLWVEVVGSAGGGGGSSFIGGVFHDVVELVR